MQTINHLIENTEWQSPILLAIFSFLLFFIAYYIFYKSGTYNSKLYEKSNATDLSIKSARIIILFGSLLIPLSGIVYYFSGSNPLMNLCLHVGLGIFLISIFILSFFLNIIKQNVHQFVVFNYFVVLAVYQAIIYTSSIEPYFVISFVLIITTSSAIINGLKTYISLAFAINVCSFLVVSMVKNPIYPIGFYLFAMMVACAVGALILLIKISISEKLIFSDTVVNKGNSIVIASNNKGEIIYASDTILPILGFTPEEVMGDKWWQLTKVDETSINPKNDLLNKKIQKQNYSRLIRHKDGSLKWIQWTDKYFSKDLVFGIGTDITLQKEYQDRFEYLVQNANDLIYTTDSFGNFTFANEMVLKITERTIDEFVGINFLDLVLPSYRKEVKSFYVTQARNYIVKTYHEFPIHTKTNRVVWVGQSVANKFNIITKEYEGSEVICRDITERITIQQRLDENNKQLALLNGIKEKILYAQSIEEMCGHILKTLVLSANASSYVAIHVNNDWQKKSHVFCISKNDADKIINYPIDYENYESLQYNFPEILVNRELLLDNNQIEIWSPLFFYLSQSFNSALVVPILFEAKIIGFINMFSEAENAYDKNDVFLLNDIANSINSFVASYKQKQIIEVKNNEIEKNNLRLDILNKSKQNLLRATSVEEIHKALITVLKKNLQNLDRVSASEFHFNLNTTQLYFLNTSNNNLIESKTIPIEYNAIIECLKRNEIYYKPNFDKETLLNEEDKHWYDVGIRSVLTAPIFIDKNLHGSVNLFSSIPDYFDDNHKLLIKEIVDSAELMIEQIIFKDIISEKNKDITDNITYAKRIQDAIMPKESILKNILPNSFLMFSQKDILGGDFYWFDEIDEKIFIAVGDCTGHGVSGALLSILASDIIKQAVLEYRLNDPGMILQYLNQKILSTLNQSTYNTSAENEIVDGLDLSFIVINKKQKSLFYASAMHSVYFIKNNELGEIKGNRKPIGSSYQSKNDFFGTHIITYKEGDTFYFFTDGYCDQFHYQTTKKFGKAKLRQTILDIQHQSMTEQYETLKRAHLSWKGKADQTDDICMIGIKL